MAVHAPIRLKRIGSGHGRRESPSLLPFDAPWKGDNDGKGSKIAAPLIHRRPCAGKKMAGCTALGALPKGLSTSLRA
jgi:hypothetical protein